MPEPSLLTRISTIHQALETRALHDGARTAFTADGSSLTYAQLHSEAEQLAGALHAAGLRRGERLALLLPAGLATIRLFWAAQRLGAAPCILNPYVPAAAAARRAARIRPALVVHDPAALPGFEAETGELHSLAIDALESLRGEAPPRTGSGDDTAFLQPTSGTSGEPRTAVVLQRNVISNLAMIQAAVAMDERDSYVAWVPPWHDLGLVRFVIGAVCLNGTCHIVPPAIQTIPLWFSTIEKTRATITAAPDFAYRIAARIVDPRVDLSSLRFAISGGEPVRASTVRMFEERFGLRNVIRPGYGLAEASLAVSTADVQQPLVTDDRGAVACGNPLPGLEVRIAAEENGVGEILVRGANVFAGYFDAPEATEAVLRDGWLHTGDIGRLDSAGRLFVLGRKRAMLKRGGAVLAPRELEETAQQVEGVKLAAAVGLRPTEERATEEIALAVEIDERRAEPGGMQTLVDAVAAEVQRAVGFVPDRILILVSRSIPRTWNGKIRHTALRDLIETGELQRRGAVLMQGGIQPPAGPNGA